MITTGLLYGLVEHYTFTTHFISSSFYSNSTSFNLQCKLSNETIRAINLASNDYCKNLLKNISCKIDSISNFFPKSLPRFCPIQKGNFGDVIGCALNDENSTHHINKSQIFDSDIMCIDYCLKHSVSFAGKV
ncbi:unnamed protein product [Rotaria sordida]|uniref:Uncharacterized protein n=1 Tax=Rotaria sordida TaxID=392033 RepID=A0A818SVN7_9BILA|nr:unnamed protein product [Rotaria sordida]